MFPMYTKKLNTSSFQDVSVTCHAQQDTIRWFHRFTNMKTVLITGANRGIGLEHTRSFAAKGWQVFATARSPSNADELNALAASHADMVTVLTYDAADP